MNWLIKAYYWLWHDIFGLEHPFTWYMRKSAKEHPLWWIVTPLGIGVAWWLLVVHLWGIL
jgi:hypothetical protein